MTRLPVSRDSRWLDPLIIAAIILLAAFFRLYRLDQLPPGLHFDEGFNAMMAQRVLTGVERPIFFTEDLTEEPMAIYITAVSFGLFGPSPWSLRLVSAVAGMMTVAASYLLARGLFQSRWIAALAAFVLAILYWHVNFSRLGMEPIFTPLTLTLTFAFLLPRLRGGGTLWQWALAGVFLASTQYTYKAALFVPVLFVAFIGVEILVDRKFWTRHARGLIVMVGVAILVFAPLGLYLVAHPEQFLERPSSVTASTTGETIADHAIQVAGMFFLRGDDNPRSNLPGRPALDPFLSIGFIAGLIACLVRLRRIESRLLLLWLGIMSLPSVLTDFAPHFGRNIGATPALALIVASGFAFVVGQVRERKTILPVTALLFAGLAFSALTTFNDYFNVWGARTGSFDSFDAGVLTLAQKLRDRPGDESIYLSPVDTHHYTVQFGLAGRAASSFDGRRVLVVPPATATYGIVTRDDPQSLARLAKIFERGRVIETIDDWTGKPYATLYRAEGTPRIAPQKSIDARLGDFARIIGYDIARAENAIVLNVYWQSIAATRDDLTAFVHLVGALNPATQSPVWAQDDARPGRGTYATPVWKPGEIVIDEYRLTIPSEARGNFQIEIGMYNLATGARVRVSDSTGAPMESNRVILERITLP